MNGRRTSRRRADCRTSQNVGWAAGVVLTALAVGCSTRTLTITQHDYINTDIHLGRPAGERTGDPLEVNVVCVYPDDLDKPQNAQLRPESGITSDIWYKYRPTEAVGAAGGNKFDLPAEQILLLTDATDFYGTRYGPTLRGAVVDGQKERVISDIKLKSLKDKRSVMFVFPLFVSREGTILPTAPVKFHPPGKHPRHLGVEIGLKDPVNRTGQFIRTTTGT